MAKITDFKIELGGEKFTIPVNCNSGGQFTCNIPSVVAAALQLPSKLIEKTFDELHTKFFSAITRYREAETKQELFILIRYAASGRYAEKKDGYPLFAGYRHPYLLGGGSTMGENNLKGLGFEFHIAIKETIDGVSNWFSTSIQGQGNTILHPELKLIEYEPENYVKKSNFYDADKCKKIPFSKTALRTLKVAEEKIRQASEMLFNFIEQDEEKILLQLTNQKLLN